MSQDISILVFTTPWQNSALRLRHQRQRLRHLPNEIFNEAVDCEQGRVIKAEVWLDPGQQHGRRGCVGSDAAHLRRGRAHRGRAARPRARRVGSDRDGPLTWLPVPAAPAPHNTSAGSAVDAARQPPACQLARRAPPTPPTHTDRHRRPTTTPGIDRDAASARYRTRTDCTVLFHTSSIRKPR